MSNFVGMVLDGLALENDLDDYVAAWHDAPDGADESSQELYEFLGMTWEEYQLVTERPPALRFVLAAHRSSRPVSEILESADEFALAARAGSESDANEVLRWLVARGRI